MQLKQILKKAYIPFCWGDARHRRVFFQPRWADQTPRTSALSADPEPQPEAPGSLGFDAERFRRKCRSGCLLSKSCGSEDEQQRGEDRRFRPTHTAQDDAHQTFLQTHLPSINQTLAQQIIFIEHSWWITPKHVQVTFHPQIKSKEDHYEFLLYAIIFMTVKIWIAVMHPYI